MGYSQRASTKSFELFQLPLASIVDIGLMKLAAVSHRGAKKDFIDLYAINENGVSLNELFDLLPRKFPGICINFYHIVKSLSYFDDAEMEQAPVMRVPMDWEEIKRYFLYKQKELLEKYSSSRQG